jgi:hypothetical protein
MKLSEELSDALTVPELDTAEKITIFIGTFVTVRTPDGEWIAEGTVEDIDPDRQLVRVRNTDSGTDFQVDVDVRLYNLWTDPLPFDVDPAINPQNLFVRASQPGVWGKQHATRVRQ